MKRLIDALDSLPFWLGVFIMAVLFVFAYAYVGNRHSVAQNADVIARQQQQLEYLCETVTVLDRLTVQQSRVTRATLSRPDVPPWAVEYLTRRANLLEVTHAELSQTRSCQFVQ